MKEKVLESELKLAYLEKLEKIRKEKTIKIGTIENLRKRYKSS